MLESYKYGPLGCVTAIGVVLVIVVMVAAGIIRVDILITH